MEQGGGREPKETAGEVKAGIRPTGPLRALQPLPPWAFPSGSRAADSRTPFLVAKTPCGVSPGSYLAK